MFHPKQSFFYRSFFKTRALFSLLLLMTLGLTSCTEGGEEDNNEALHQRAADVGCWDGDPVATPSSDQLVDKKFIDAHSPAVGVLMGCAACSGTLISEDLFLTAGHCVDAGLPTHIDFGYQLEANGSFSPDFNNIYPVRSLVEKWNGGLDYAIVRLGKNMQGKLPGATITPAKLAGANCGVGKVVAMIGHPGGGFKEIDTGYVLRYADPWMYADVTGVHGNSGSGILCAETGKLTGVYRGGGCTTSGAASSHIEVLIKESPTLRGLVPTISFDWWAFYWAIFPCNMYLYNHNMDLDDVNATTCAKDAELARVCSMYCVKY